MILWPLTLFVVFVNFSCFSVAKSRTWTPETKLLYRESTRELWEHGYDSYMSYAFPSDELMPISCWGRGPDWDDTSNIGMNDVAGNYSLTLVDVLDTLAIMGDQEGFEDAVKTVIEWVQFDVNTKPQVFEVTIRVLGGLLSAHILASEEKLGHKIEWYQGQLLNLAKDLGERLLPAFQTPTGLPFARINLKHGLDPNETTETCVAGAGSLIMEFATLSRLTNDDRFEKAAFKAFFALWNNRSELGLVGNNVDVVTGQWSGQQSTGIGAGVDSFYEYALKWYIMSGEPEFLDVWNEAYASVMTHARAHDGYSYRIIDMNRGQAVSSNVDSLSAFWAGLQVLAGDVQGAIKSHLYYWNLWRKYRAIPELFDAVTHKPVVLAYPLRPEFIESTFFLYQATKDPFYLDVGAQVLKDLQETVKTKCGLASIGNILENKLDDRMESFALSETLKYLYLLFDEDNPLANSDSNILFTTEGHILTLNSTHIRPMSKIRRETRKHDNSSCPRYQAAGEEETPHLRMMPFGIRNRPEYDFARTLVGFDMESAATKQDLEWLESGGVCEVPKIRVYSFEFLLSRTGFAKTVEDTDTSSLKRKLVPWRDGVLVMEVMGLMTHVKSRLDGQGYDITKIGHLNVRQGEKVYINDTRLFGDEEQGRGGDGEVEALRPRSVPLKIYTTAPDDPTRLPLTPDGDGPVGDIGANSEFVTDADTAEFGEDPNILRVPPGSKFNTSIPYQGVHLVKFPDNSHGCSPYNDPSGRINGSMVFIERGDCLFIEKLAYARQAGALGVVVWHNTEERFNPSAEPEDIKQYGAAIRGGIMLVVPPFAASIIQNRLRLEEEDPTKTAVMVQIEREWPVELLGDEPIAEPQTMPTQTKPTSGRVLYINGHAMMNTELLF